MRPIRRQNQIGSWQLTEYGANTLCIQLHVMKFVLTCRGRACSYQYDTQNVLGNVIASRIAISTLHFVSRWLSRMYAIARSEWYASCMQTNIAHAVMHAHVLAIVAIIHIVDTYRISCILDTRRTRNMYQLAYVNYEHRGQPYWPTIRSRNDHSGNDWYSESVSL